MAPFDEETQNAARQEHKESDRPQSTARYLWQRFLKAFLVLYLAVMAVIGCAELMRICCWAVDRSTVFALPLTDLYVDIEMVSQFLSQFIPIRSFQLGPVTIFFTPLSLLNVRWPFFVPFKKSYVAVTLMDFRVPQPELLLYLHLYPSLYLYLPTRFSPYRMSLSLLSFSVISVPLELLGFSVSVPLWSLFDFRLSGVCLELVPFPGIERVKRMPSAASIPHIHEGLNLGIKDYTVADAYVSILGTSWRSNNSMGASVPLVSSPEGFYVPAPLRFLASFIRWY